MATTVDWPAKVLVAATIKFEALSVLFCGGQRSTTRAWLGGCTWITVADFKMDV